jgi:8-oxo-dGTP diphosphatase
MDINTLSQHMHDFVAAKGWYDPESPKPQTLRNLVISLNLEAAEVLELLQWREETPDKQALAGELADVSLYLLQIASVSGIDLEKAILEKLQENYNRAWDETPTQDDKQ